MSENQKGKGRGGLFGALQNAADSVKNTVQGIKLPEVKLPEIKIPNPFQGKPKTEVPAGLPAEIRSISPKSAIKMVYYMMAADGEIHEEEEKTFCDVGKEFDPDFENHKDQIMNECKNQLAKIIDPDDYPAVLQDGVEELILAGANDKGSSITPKILVWDLLTVAYSDQDYSEKERTLLKYIIRKFNISKEVFLEMESSYLALSDIEKELQWIKTTDRPYLTIEAIVNELNDRKTVILDSIKDLIAF